MKVNLNKLFFSSLKGVFITIVSLIAFFNIINLLLF